MIRHLLVANRGEIALRILRCATDLGVRTLAVASADDATALHLRHADATHALPGSGPAAYLDSAALLAAARQAGCDAVHPGYGFLSESADFARACAAAGLRFVGPTPEQLVLLGDKAQARALAQRCGVPVLPGTSAAVTRDEAHAFLQALGQPVMIKALAGGGGRGIRLVRDAAALDEAYTRCQSEALRSFGDGRVYVEQALGRARHIEIQVLGDGQGGVMHLGERDCSVQRRNQKLIEICPSPRLDAALRTQLLDAALRMAREIGYANAGTFEFLVDVAAPAFYFLEANPRLQVEHTVTEEIWGVDLVAAQLHIAAGATLAELGLQEARPRKGFALQARVNMERLLEDGTPVMDGGTLLEFAPPSGPGIRVDTCGYRGYMPSPAFDSLLAKVVVTSADASLAGALGRAGRALSAFTLQGVANNIALLRAILAHPLLDSDALSTGFVDANLPELLVRARELADAVPAEQSPPQAAMAPAAAPALPEGAQALPCPFTGTIVRVLVAQGDSIVAGQPLLVVEAMKMEHLIHADSGGTVQAVLVAEGASVQTGQALLLLQVDASAAGLDAQQEELDLEAIRPDLAEVLERQRGVQDAGRPEAVARRHAKGARTARENVLALCDAGSFVEHGALVVAAQRERRAIDELIRRTPGDGVVTGFGAVNGAQFPREAAQSLVIAFDETVLAGTMGEMARDKLRHVLAVAWQARCPVVLLAEGGGGRAGDTGGKVSVTGWTMDVACYYQFGRLSGLVPLVGVTSGRCFAANAGLLACCDVIIATRDANIGVGGPTMIEGGRLGQFTPEQIGPMAVQTANGVVDLLADDEAHATDLARRYLAYFQGSLPTWEAPDQRAARFVVPENRLRAYDVRKAIAVLADTGSVLELRAAFGVGMITALVRVEGRALGVIANNPMHLGGAIDSAGADKASRFMRLCEAFGLPILMLCDTPGVMVGPQAETEATVRKMGRMFVTGANLSVPFFTIVLRKAYGIGAELMAGGWFKAPRFVVSWPTGEFGGMNIEGNVKLAHGAQLDAIADPADRAARFDALVAGMYATGRALAVATHNEIDDVIDPADSRAWIRSALASHRDRAPQSAKSVPYVDPW